MNLSKKAATRDGGYISLVSVCLILVVFTFLFSGGVARADHPSGNGSVGAVLGNKPEVLERVTVQIRDTQGTQIVVENSTEKPLEVYDENGEPFLRIGPRGVEANRSAIAFYETYGPRGINAPKGSEDAQGEDWKKISDQPSWGWFDRRLRTDDIEIPEEIAQRGEAANFGEWELPMKLGDENTALRGSYSFRPQPQGTYLASITSEPESGEVNAQISQGYGGATAILLQNDGEDPVTVLDGRGDPAIEIGPEEVRANLSSPIGREASRGTSTGTTGASSGTGQELGNEKPRWKTIAGGSSFTWQDPRLSTGESSREDVRWEIPLQSSGEGSRVAGTTEWRPLKSEPNAGAGDSGDEHSSQEHSVAGGNHSNNETTSGARAYEVQLGEINGSAVSGTGLVEFGEEDQVKVTVDARNVEPGRTHEMHIHGLRGGEDATCPSDGKTRHHDMESAVGYHVLNLEPYSEADVEGHVTFEGSFPEAAGSLRPLEDKALVVHGMNTDGGYDPEAPVACGEFRAAETDAGGEPTALLGAAGGNQMVLYVLLGLVALALPAAGLALSRRWRSSLP